MGKVVERPKHLVTLRRLLRDFPVVAIIGVRQVGKTWLARRLAESWRGATTVFDLEDPTDLARLSDPPLALRELRGLVVIDEVQRRPDLFPLLRVLADRRPLPARFLVLGSASPDLLRQGSESLAGRIVFHRLDGLDLAEVGPEQQRRLWLRGGLPTSFLARSEQASVGWRQAFVRTFLERDLPALGIAVPPATMARFWSMLAHCHGQVWNAAAFAGSFAVSDATVRRYLDHLASALVVRLLQPWHENLGKRQVRTPKLYIGDSGLLHALLNLTDRNAVERHPKLGASWEGFALSQVVRLFGCRDDECFFWRTHAGAELDLLVVRGDQRRGFEFKYSSAPVLTPSMRHALVDLRLDQLDVVHPGEHVFPLAPRVRALPIALLADHLRA